MNYGYYMHRYATADKAAQISMVKINYCRDLGPIHVPNRSSYQSKVLAREAMEACSAWYVSNPSIVLLILCLIMLVPRRKYWFRRLATLLAATGSKRFPPITSASPIEAALLMTGDARYVENHFDPRPPKSLQQRCCFCVSEPAKRNGL